MIPSIIVICIVFFAIRFLIAAARNSNSHTPDSTSSNPSHPAALDFHESTENGVTFTTYRLSGAYAASRSRVSVRIQFIAEDVTAGGALAVGCRVAELFPSGFIKVDRDATFEHQLGLVTGMPVALIPSNELVFATRGTRTVRYSVKVFEERTGNVLLTASITRSQTQLDYGYAEQAELRDARIECMARIATAIALADGELGADEKKLITGLVRRETERLPDAARQIANDKVQRSLQLIRTQFRAGMTCRELVDRALYDLGTGMSLQFRASLYEDATRVACADSRMQPTEIAALGQLQKALEISDDRAREIRDRYVRLAMLSGNGDEATLGIDPSWTKERRLTHLRDEYRKWNSRVTHSDPTIAHEAETRRDLIARVKARIEGVGKGA